MQSEQQDLKNTNPEREHRPKLPRLVRWGLYLFSALLFLLLAGYVVLQLPAVQKRLRHLAVSAVERQLTVKMDVGRISGNLLQHLTLHDLRLVRGGRQLLNADRISVHYRLLPLLRRSFQIRLLRGEGIRLDLVQDAAGQWNLPSSGKSVPSPSGAAAFDLRIDRFSLADSRLTVAPREGRTISVNHLNLEAVLLVGDTIGLNLQRAGFTLQPAALSIRNLHGSLLYRPGEQQLAVRRLTLETAGSHLVLDGSLQRLQQEPTLDAELRIETLSFEELDRMLPGPSLQNRPLQGTIRLTGTAAALQHQIRLQMQDQRFTANGQASFFANGRWRLETSGSVNGFDPSRLPLAHPPALGGELNADFALQFQNPTHGDRRAKLSVGLSASRIETVTLNSGDLAMELQEDTLTVTAGRLAATAGELQLRGRISKLTGKPFLDAEIGVRKLKLGQLPLPAPVSGVLNFDTSLQAEQIGADQADPASWQSRVTLQVQPSKLQGTTLTEARLKARWDRGMLSVEQLRFDSGVAGGNLSGSFDHRKAAWQVQGDLRVHDLRRLQDLVTHFVHLPDLLEAPAGALKASGSARGDDRELQTTLTLQGSLTASRPVWPARFAPTGNADFELTLQARHHGDQWGLPAAWNGQIHLQSARSWRLWDTQIRKTSLRAEWDGRRLGIPQLEIDSEIVDASLQGSLAGHARAAEVTGKIEFPELQRLQPVLQRLAPPPYANLSPAGSLRVEGSGAADAGRWEIDTELNAAELSLQGSSAASVSLKTRWQGRPGDFTASAEGRVEDFSSNGRRLTRVDIRADATHRFLVLDLQARAENEGRLQLAGQADDWLGPIRRIRVDLLKLQHPPAPVQGWLTTLHNRGPLIFSLSSDAVEIEAMPLALDGSELALNGSLRRSGEQDLTLHLRGFPLAALFDRSEAPADMDGRLDLAARIFGTAETPQIEAQLSIALDSEAAGMPTDMNLQLTYRRDALRVQGQGRRDGNRLFGMEGGLDLALRLLPFQFRPRPGSLDLTLTADGLQMAQLPVPLPETWDIEGLVDLQLRAVGDLTAPALSGYAALHEGRLRLGDAGLSFEEFSARIQLEPERVRIDQVSLRGDREGTLEVAGTISLDGWQPSDYNLQFTGANLQIPYRDVAVARMNADLKFAGSRSRPSLTGRLDVLQGRIDLDRIAAGMPADIEIVSTPQPEDRRWVYRSDFEQSGFFDALTADVLMVIRGDTWVKGKGVNAEISGNLELTKQAQQPFRLIGTLETVRGNYKFQGKLFRITTGTVSFTGQPEPNPELNIEARTQIRRVDIVVAISGQADRLRLELSSDPPMEQSDILSYLVFGRPSSELRWQQSASVESAALGMTGNLAAAELEGIFEEALNLDMLTFEFSDEEFDQSTLALGKYVARNIFVTYRHGIATRGFGQVEVDYQINRNFTLQAQLGDELSSGVDLIWELDF